MNFFEFVTFGVVQEYDEAVVIAELRQRFIQPDYVIQALGIVLWAVPAGQGINAARRQLSFVDTDKPLAGETPPVIDEVVVQDATDPGARFLDLDQVVELAEELH